MREKKAEKVRSSAMSSRDDVTQQPGQAAWIARMTRIVDAAGHALVDADGAILGGAQEEPSHQVAEKGLAVTAEPKELPPGAGVAPLDSSLDEPPRRCLFLVQILTRVDPIRGPFHGDDRDGAVLGANGHPGQHRCFVVQTLPPIDR